MESGTATYALLLFLFIILYFMDSGFCFLFLMLGILQAW